MPAFHRIRVWMYGLSSRVCLHLCFFVSAKICCWWIGMFPFPPDPPDRSSILEQFGGALRAWEGREKRWATQLTVALMKDQLEAWGNQEASGFTVWTDGRITCCQEWVAIEAKEFHQISRQQVEGSSDQVKLLWDEAVIWGWRWWMYKLKQKLFLLMFCFNENVVEWSRQQLFVLFSIALDILGCCIWEHWAVWIHEEWTKPLGCCQA